MNPASHDFAFLPLPMRRHKVVEGDKSRYRVYQYNGEFRTIEAKTAYEAFKASGFKEASRIVRVTRYVNPSIHKNELSEVTDNAPELKAASPVKVADTAAHPAFVAAPPASGAPIIQPESIDRAPLTSMQRSAPLDASDGIEEISSVSTPIQIKVPQRTLEAEAPGAASLHKKPERTMLSVQDIDKLLGK